MRFAIATAFAIGCSGPTITGTTCTTDADCNLFNAQGTCQPTGFCSFPDPSCPDGQRYTPGAGDGLAGTCVGEAAVCGGQGQACCGVDTCGPDLACADGACSCGASGQPCCGGTTCETGLACDGVCGGSKVEQVAVGAGHVCALREDKTVWCWGFDFKPFPFSAPGLSTSIIDNPAPAPVAGLTDVVAIRAAEHHTCALASDATLVCWGHNERGQLGNATNASSSTPVAVDGLTNVTKFDGGRMHTCALGDHLGTAGLWCWGRNGEKQHTGNAPNANFGRLGNNTTVDSNVPVAVDLSVAAGAGQTVKALATGAYHSCIVMSDDKVWCWGKNNVGQLGNGLLDDTMVPVQVDLTGVTIPNGATIDEVTCNDGRRRDDSTCLRLSTGAIFCWGANDNGELGDDTTTSRNTPSLAVIDGFGGAKPVQLATGSQARCARTDAGTVFCWGRDKAGVLGIGLSNDQGVVVPTPTRNLTGVTQLDMGHRTACAIDAGRVFCWGTNTRGQSKGRPAVDMADKSTIEPFHVVF